VLSLALLVIGLDNATPQRRPAESAGEARRPHLDAAVDGGLLPVVFVSLLLATPGWDASADSECSFSTNWGAPASLRFQRGHVAYRVVAGTSKPVISSRVRVVRRARRAGHGRRRPGRSRTPDLEIVHLRASLSLRLGELPLAQTSSSPGHGSRAHWATSRFADRRRREPRSRRCWRRGRPPASSCSRGAGRSSRSGWRVGGGRHPGGRRAPARLDRDAPVARDARRAPRIAASARCPGARLGGCKPCRPAVAA
jgi:hypothetical protein